jgi:hypothetical protein
MESLKRMATVNNPYCLESMISVERNITVKKALEILQSNQPPFGTTAADWRAAWDKATTSITEILLDEDNLA